MKTKWPQWIARIFVIVVTPSLLLYTCLPQANGLTILCSNDTRICEAWQQGLERDLGIRTRYISIPTQDALNRLQHTHNSGEFDIWVGGPSENYRIAAQRGLLRSSKPTNAKHYPAEYHDHHGRWYGVYASILAFCSNPEVLRQLSLDPPTSWSELQQPHWHSWISAPSPLTSGTGYSMLLTQDAVGIPADQIAEMLANVGRFTRSGNAPSSVVSNGEAAVAISFQPYCAATQPQQLIVTFPTDGTSYEIAAGAIVEGTQRSDAAERALDWLLSPTGQLTARHNGLPQIPVNPDVEGNLEALLKQSALPIQAVDQHQAVAQRSIWLSWFAAHAKPTSYNSYSDGDF